MLGKFIDWYLQAPLYQSIWFTPFVVILGALALIKNLVTGETKINEKEN